MKTLLKISTCLTFLWTIQHQGAGRASCFVLNTRHHCHIDINTKYNNARDTTTSTKRWHPGNFRRMEKVHQRLMMISTTSSQQQQINHEDLELVHTTTDEMAIQTTDQGVPTTTTTAPIIPSTLPHAIRVFFFGAHKGPIVVLTLLLSLLFQRIMMPTPIQSSDYLTASLSILFWCFQEHFIHGRLLHSKFNWIGKDIHHTHHEEPYFHISIDPVELLVGWMLAAYLLFRTFLPSTAMATSATIGYATAGMWYEWTHYLVHTKVRPKSKFATRVRDGHMKHHLVNEEYWLGFTVPFVDDLLGTNPSVREAREEKKNGKVRGGRKVVHPVVAPR